MCIPYTPLRIGLERLQVDYSILATNFIQPGDGNGETGGTSVIFAWGCRDGQDERERANNECNQNTHCDREPEASPLQRQRSEYCSE